MITLSASGGSVTFTFSGNSTYLNDGQITVPVNSLALIIDESDMATFRKAASNDIFVSANIAEFGMTKAELESWYKANMVSSGGGGGGVTPEEVEEMIDESISGKADSSAVTEEISAALSGKQDTLIAGDGINIDSANTISAVYRGYVTMNPQYSVENYSGQLYIANIGDDIFDVFWTAEQSWDYAYFFGFDFTAKTYSITSAPQGRENDWQNYFTIEFDEDVQMFKVTTLQEVAYINTSGLSNILRIGSEYNDYSVLYSGATSDALDDIIDNVNNLSANKQDTLIAGENITISGNVISASDGTVDGTSLFGGTHHTTEGTSIKYFSQMLEGQKPSALKFVVAYGNNTYSSAATITLYDTEDYNEHSNTLTISSSGGAVTSITEANGGSFTGITIDDDCVLRPAEGYFFNSYQWLTNNNVLGLRILPKDGVIESGSTTDVIENGIYKQLQRHEENIGNLALSAVTSTKLSFKDESGITLSTNASSTALAVDDSLKYNGKLGVYVTGDTYTNVFNSESATTYLMLDGIKNVDMWLNQSYTGTPSGWYTISVQNLDNSNDYYLYENDAFTFVSGTAGSTLNYDSSTGKVTITCPSGISSISNGSKFAPADDLTNADSFIGLVSYTSNEYPLQEAIDSKVDTSDVTTAVTSGSTDVVTSGGVYAKMGGMTIVKITESEYAALVDKDANTLYVVIPDPTNP